MPQLLLPDNIPPLVKASSTTCTLASTHLGQPTRIKIGGQQYKLSSSLTLNTATTGLGGLDTGALGSAHQLYYVYACANDSGVVGLVASLTDPSTGPSGFTSRYKFVGAFYAADTAAIASTVSITGPAVTEWYRFTTSITGLGSKGTDYNYAEWRRNADTLEVRGSISTPSSPAAGAGATDFTVSVGSGRTMDSSKFTGAFVGVNRQIGIAQLYGVVTATQFDREAAMFIADSTTLRIVKPGTATALTQADFNNTVEQEIWYQYWVPITGWKTTLLG